MASNNPFGTRQVCTYFYKAINDAQVDPTAYFRCKCSVVRKQAPWSRYNNLFDLFDYVLKRHPDFVATLMDSGINTAKLVSWRLSPRRSSTVFSTTLQ
ncbi:hypothetical protein PHMEG_00041257 [Phytophthora megakarya]|uniref:Uncharacterized protein n=1 Tax=Phytophthora megakarya TaxID=4795 RepID=A0A225UBS7_9STRA|nr:hypothetical protein PHMEG_00041257 [Phytophthora megakarya]